MPFALNGNILLNPTTHNWVAPASYGTSLVGRVLYGGVLSYELNWSMLNQEQFNVLVNTYVSGSCVADLPPWRGVATPPYLYDFESYTGTYLSMPSYQSYFEGNYQGVKVLINNVIV
jgi:hypothetical protein